MKEHKHNVKIINLEVCVQDKNFCVLECSFWLEFRILAAVFGTGGAIAVSRAMWVGVIAESHGKMDQIMADGAGFDPSLTVCGAC